MDSFEFNKIAAAVLIVALLIIGLNQIADSIYHVKKPETPGYKIEGVTETKTSAKGEEKKRGEISRYKSFTCNSKCCCWRKYIQEMCSLSY